MAYAVYMRDRKKYLSDSIELWEYQADDQLHAKISVYDGRYTMIGSFNLDERSAHIDTESVLIIDSQAFAAAVERYIDDAYLGRLESVRIIHGKGTGALRQTVHDTLRRHKRVKGFRLGRYGEGETGVTVVELK